MQNKICHFIAFLLLAFVLPAFGTTNGLKESSCSDLLDVNDLLITSPVQKFQESLPALVSRIRPVYANDRFDIRILSQSISRNTFSPVKLKERTVGEISQLQKAYDKLGFQFNSYLQALVEAQPNAMGELQLGPNFQFIWHNSTMKTPWIGNAREMIGIPNLLGFRSLFVGRVDKMGFEELPKFLVLPAPSGTYHSLQNKFLIAHELAHVTENKKSHQDLIWREARADFLAYLTTGETDIVFPEGISLDLVKHDGSIYEKTVTKARSIKDPTVAKVGEAMPHLDAYHHNSQIISSALFELSQKLGQQKVVELIQWMDSLEEAKTIPKLVAKPKDPADLIVSPEIEYVDSENLESVRGLIESHLLRIGYLIRLWGSELTDETSRATIEIVLSQRQI